MNFYTEKQPCFQTAQEEHLPSASIYQFGDTGGTT